MSQHPHLKQPHDSDLERGRDHGPRPAQDPGWPPAVDVTQEAPSHRYGAHHDDPTIPHHDAAAQRDTTTMNHNDRDPRGHDHAGGGGPLRDDFDAPRGMGPRHEDFDAGRGGTPRHDEPEPRSGAARDESFDGGASRRREPHLDEAAAASGANPFGGRDDTATRGKKRLLKNPLAGKLPAVTRSDMRLVSTALMAVTACAILAAASFKQVPLGTVGIKTGIGQEGAEIIGPGRYIVMPWVEQVHLVSTGEIAVSFKPEQLLAGDALPVHSADIEVVYRVRPESVSTAMALESLETDAGDVARPLRQKIQRDTDRLVQSVFGEVNSEDLQTLRHDLGALVQRTLNERLTDQLGDTVEVSSVTISGLEVDDRVREIIAQRNWERTEQRLNTSVRRSPRDADDLSGNLGATGDETRDLLAEGRP